MRRQQQRVGQLIDGSCHVAEDEAGAEPVGGTVGQHDFPQFQAGQLQRLTPKAVQAIALVEARRKQLRSRPSPLLDEVPDAIGIMPDVVVLLLGHRNDDLFGPARHLREGVSRSRSNCRVFGRASILASPSLKRSRMTKMPPAGYPAFLDTCNPVGSEIRAFAEAARRPPPVPTATVPSLPW